MHDAKFIVAISDKASSNLLILSVRFDKKFQWETYRNYKRVSIKKICEEEKNLRNKKRKSDFTCIVWVQLLCMKKIVLWGFAMIWWFIQIVIEKNYKSLLLTVKNNSYTDIYLA